MPLLGAHMSIQGGVHKALVRGQRVGCRVIRLFTGKRMTWGAEPLSGEEIALFHKAREGTAIAPVAIHNSYLNEQGRDWDAVNLNLLKRIVEGDNL